MHGVEDLRIGMKVSPPSGDFVVNRGGTLDNGQDEFSRKE
jgi:hypothetical protein